MHLTAFALTDTGRRRESNEDSYCLRQNLGLYVIADGMGGHAAGEVASRVAVDAIESFVEHTIGVDNQYPFPFGFDPGLGVDGNRIASAFRLANRQILQRTIDEPELRGMATTGVALLTGIEMGSGGAGASDGPVTLAALVAHVGDSRAYFWREGRLEQITHDHSWVEEQIAAGAMSIDEARQHPWRNLVTRALAGSEDPEIDITPIALEPGDRVLLCSDGLTTPLTDAAIAEVIARSPLGNPAATCQALVDAANAAGGPDNITVVIVEVDRS